MEDREYYSLRNGLNKKVVLNLKQLKISFENVYDDFNNRCFFQEAFGYYCVDREYVPGKFYSEENVNNEFLLAAGAQKELWPIRNNLTSYSENELFDMIEFLFDHISAPIEGYYHNFSNCGYHYHKFDKKLAREEYKEKINKLLNNYGEGYEIDNEGHICLLAPSGYEILTKTALIGETENNKKVSLAIILYKRSRNLEQRRIAIRELADMLEHLRPQLRQHLKNDESDLFNIINNFGIRHHNDIQKINYNKPIFYSWMFYVLLATIHAIQRIITKESITEQ